MMKPKSTIKKLFFLFLLSTGVHLNLKAQFSDSFTIKYTKKVNVHKKLSKYPWAESMINSLPKFMSENYILTSKNGVNHYKPVVNEDDTKEIPFWMTMGGPNEIITTRDSFKLRKVMYDLKLKVEDTLIKYKWKITDDKRTIAGYNCRKAVAVFHDSMIIYAFYCDELTSSCGPELIGGLPGAILGLGIPKIYTTWFADKVEIHAQQFENKFKFIKKEKQYNFTTLKDEMKSMWDNRWDSEAENSYWTIFF